METIFHQPYMGRVVGMAMGGVTEAVAFGSFSHVQIWRPSQVNARIAVLPLVIVLTATATVRIGFSSVALADNDGIVESVDRADLGQDRVEIRSETNVAQVAVTNAIVNFEVPGGVPFPFPGPLFFRSLEGITLNPIVNGVGISLFAQWREGVEDRIV